MARARQLLDKEEELVSLERQLLAKQDALYWREQCLRSEHEAAPPAMPPLIQIQAQPRGIVGVEPREIERRRVTLAYQPDRQHQLQQNPETSVKQVLTAATVYNITYLFNGGGVARRYAPRLRQFDSRRIYVRPPLGPQSAHLWWPASCLCSCATQPACYNLGRERQTDGSQYRLMHPYGGRRTNETFKNLRNSYVVNLRQS